MAFHNFLIMVLFRLGTLPVFIRTVQIWKEAIIALLVVVAGLRLYRAYRDVSLGRPTALDWVEAGLLRGMLVYLALPAIVRVCPADPPQRLLAFRILALLP